MGVWLLKIFLVVLLTTSAVRSLKIVRNENAEIRLKNDLYIRDENIIETIRMFTAKPLECYWDPSRIASFHTLSGPGNYQLFHDKSANTNNHMSIAVGTCILPKTGVYSVTFQYKKVLGATAGEGLGLWRSTCAETFEDDSLPLYQCGYEYYCQSVCQATSNWGSSAESFVKIHFVKEHAYVRFVYDIDFGTIAAWVDGTFLGVLYRNVDFLNYDWYPAIGFRVATGDAYVTFEQTGNGV